MDEPQLGVSGMNSALSCSQGIELLATVVSGFTDSLCAKQINLAAFPDFL